VRLTAVKLAGFKSFVDPTTFFAPTNLTGIVGPNGCGKSNIIDAVRWVMGEGSAKVLRGDNMADVIFKCSATRKPVAPQLSARDARRWFGAQDAGYNEISIKRQVSRDGVSVYFLNGTRCRRRDVRDLFLGTGLGSGSYSIIEQGMISEVVDARPEEIRAHLEEAAGISKYKERRHETENRIAHTRDTCAAHGSSKKSASNGSFGGRYIGGVRSYAEKRMEARLVAAGAAWRPNRACLAWAKRNSAAGKHCCATRHGLNPFIGNKVRPVKSSAKCKVRSMRRR
jgi:energy-coupling factor transporter ATP-binding protein EcfA2